MAVVLAYVDAVPGRLYPLVATLLELAHRGHRVAVRCGIDDVERLRSLGLDTSPLRREIERFEPDDWRARTRFGALSSGLGQFGERARFQLLDLEQKTIAEISAQTGWNQTLVKVRAFRARRKLQKLFQDLQSKEKS